jgi:hypothetical protein
LSLAVETIAPIPALDYGRQLMAFNWLTAGYAHRDWLGEWGDLLEPRPQASARLLRRASMVLLSRHGLRERYLRETSRYTWLLKPSAVLMRVADHLGTAMLGGWVQHELQRREVLTQIRIMGPERRAAALVCAQRLKALPFCAAQQQWPLGTDPSNAVPRLGLSCLAAMLNDHSSGARERFTFRFAPKTLTPIALSNAQLEEAAVLVQEAVDGTWSTT